MKINYFTLPGLVGVKELRINSVKNIVLDYLGVTWEGIIGNNRRKKLSDARKILVYFIDKYCGKMSSVYIGSLINRDHATILYYFKKVEAFRAFDPDFREVMEQIEYRIKQHNETI